MKQPNKNRTFGKNETDSKQTENDQPPDLEVLTSPSLVCAGCGALHQYGKWSWNQLPNKVAEGLCPACERINNQNPAGYITLTGKFVLENRDEILALVTNVAASELALQPLERLINIENNPDSIEITTTGVIIARQIGYALNIAFQGHLETTSEEDETIHINWKHD